MERDFFGVKTLQDSPLSIGVDPWRGFFQTRKAKESMAGVMSTLIVRLSQRGFKGRSLLTWRYLYFSFP